MTAVVLTLRDPLAGLPEGCREANFYFYDFYIEGSSSAVRHCSKCGVETYFAYGKGDYTKVERLLCFKCMWQEGCERWEKEKKKE